MVLATLLGEDYAKFEMLYDENGKFIDDYHIEFDKSGSFRIAYAVYNDIKNGYIHRIYQTSNTVMSICTCKDYERGDEHIYFINGICDLSDVTDNELRILEKIYRDAGNEVAIKCIEDEYKIRGGE